MTMRMMMLVALSALASFPVSARAEEPTRLEEVHVPGRVHGPSVRVFLSRSRPSTERAELRDSFTREIVTSTSGSPF